MLRAYSCPFQRRKRFLETSKLGLSKGGIKRVFDVGKVRIHAFDM